ncbi:MAG TPA: TIGR03086 family metal-binding protein [Streptosporangiaceae bacterium]
MSTVRSEYRLLERAVRYALSGAGHATTDLLGRPTPCPGWDLRTLLLHLGGSFDTVAGGLRTRVVGPDGRSSGTEGPAGAPSVPEQDGELVAGLAGRAARLLWACAGTRGGEDVVNVGDRRLTASVVAITGAIEVAVHGWDIFISCGDDQPVPSRLATELLPYAALLVPRHTRPGLFADPVLVPRRTSAGDRLVAFLGRRPTGIMSRAGEPGPPGR